MAVPAVEAIQRGAGWAARTALRLAAAAAVALLVIGVYLFRDGWPEGGEGVGRLIVLAIAAAPPVVLFLLAQALQALAELPARLRAMPADARSRLEELGRVAGDEHAARATRLPFTLWRLGRVAGSSRELLTPHAPLLPLVSLPFLGAAAVSAAVALVEIAVALVLALILLV